MGHLDDPAVAPARTTGERRGGVRPRDKGAHVQTGGDAQEPCGYAPCATPSPKALPHMGTPDLHPFPFPFPIPEGPGMRVVIILPAVDGYSAAEVAVP